MSCYLVCREHDAIASFFRMFTLLRESRGQESQQQDALVTVLVTEKMQRGQMDPQAIPEAKLADCVDPDATGCKQGCQQEVTVAHEGQCPMSSPTFRKRKGTHRFSDLTPFLMTQGRNS